MPVGTFVSGRDAVAVLVLLALLYGRPVPTSEGLLPFLGVIGGFYLVILILLAAPMAALGRLTLPTKAPSVTDLDALADQVEARRAEKRRSAIIFDEPVADIPAQFVQVAHRFVNDGGDGPLAAAVIAKAVSTLLRPSPLPALRLVMGVGVLAMTALAYTGDGRTSAAGGAVLIFVALSLLQEIRKIVVMGKERAVEHAWGEPFGTGTLIRRSEVEGMRTSPMWVMYGAALDLIWLGCVEQSEDLCEYGRTTMTEVEACYSSIETSKELWGRHERKKRFGTAY